MSAYELLKRADEVYAMRKLAFLAGVEAFCLQAGMSRSALVPIVKVAEELVEGSGDLHEAMHKCGAGPEDYARSFATPTNVAYGSSGGRIKGNRPYIPPTPTWDNATKQTMTPTVGSSAQTAAPTAPTEGSASSTPAQAPRRSEGAAKTFGTAEQLAKSNPQSGMSNWWWAGGIPGAVAGWAYNNLGDQTNKDLQEKTRYEVNREGGKVTEAKNPTTDVEWKQMQHRNAGLARETLNTAYQQYLTNASSMGPAQAAVFSQTEHPGAFEHIEKTFKDPKTGKWTYPTADMGWAPGKPYDPAGPGVATMAAGGYNTSTPTSAAAPTTTPAPAPTTSSAPPDAGPQPSTMANPSPP